MKKWIDVILVGVLQLVVTSYAHSETTLSLEPGSRLWLIGDSTLHAFTSTTHELIQTSRLDTLGHTGPVILWDAVLKNRALTALQLTIPVKSLKSKETALDKNMYSDLKADTYPQITFRLSSYDTVPSTVTAVATHIVALGTLTVAGQDQPITLEIEAEPEKDDGLRVQGHATLLMSQYGIKPRIMFMGALKTKDRVDIYFDLHWRAL